MSVWNFASAWQLSRPEQATIIYLHKGYFEVVKLQKLAYVLFSCSAHIAHLVKAESKAAIYTFSCGHSLSASLFFHTSREPIAKTGYQEETRSSTLAICDSDWRRVQKSQDWSPTYSSPASQTMSAGRSKSWCMITSILRGKGPIKLFCIW